jgi:hypothetical protein
MSSRVTSNLIWFDDQKLAGADAYCCVRLSVAGGYLNTEGAEGTEDTEKKNKRFRI